MTNTVEFSNIRAIRTMGAAGAYQTLRAILSSPTQSHLIVCPNEESADTFEANASALLSPLGLESFQIVRFPAWEHSPYSAISPAMSTRLGRLSALSQIHAPAPNESKAYKIIVSSVQALAQRTLPAEIFKKYLLRISAGDVLESRQWLENQLGAMGYDRTDPVTDPGTYSIRGEIVDIFPVSQTLPIRIELFDTLVEKIRLFEPVSQRVVSSPESLGNTPREIFVTPAREFLVNGSTVETIVSRLKEFCDHRSISRKIRDPLAEQIRNSQYPEHSDTWIPFAYARPETLLEHTKQISTIVVEPHTCAKELRYFLDEQNQLCNDHDQTIAIAPDVVDVFSDVSKIIPSSDESDSSPEIPILPIAQSLEQVRRMISSWIESGFQVHLFSPSQTQLDRIQFLLNLDPILSRLLHLHQNELTESFEVKDPPSVFLSEATLFGKSSAKKVRPKTRASSDPLPTVNALKEGDLVVHVEHGLARYAGLTRLSVQNSQSDFIVLEYARNDRFYLPVYRLDCLQKYLGGSSDVKLDSLGSGQFEKAKEKVRKSVRELAFSLVDLYAKRALQEGFKTAARGEEYREFESSFPYDETPDQLKATEDIFADFESGRILDRLVCGDVGFGKTEVAMRAAFQMIVSGKQVAVLVPTTLLAFQHEQTFRERFKKAAVSIASVSRLKTPTEAKKILQETREGKIDLLIGTHRLLSSDIEFHNLGLMIVDEEHRFGVEHKEKLKTLALNTHVLTLTATPIPRTLHMSLAGIRDISLMTTPPVNRLPVRTFVSVFDWDVIKKAIETELRRGGQIYFLHNHVASIELIARKLKEIVPQCRVGIGHGQMGEKALEQVMLQFYRKEIDCLLCTTIIESGLDVPNANTLIVDKADHLGLAQLYQIRGRVGRSDQRAFAYLLVSETGRLSDDARKRLDVIQRFVELGSGYSVASYDLEIRGGGNLLGAEQSGHIASIGFELYSELLEEAIQEIRQTPKTERFGEPEIKSKFPAFISEDYVPDTSQRLSLYRKLSASTQEHELLSLENEMSERFGPLPPETQQLLWLIRLKMLLRSLGVKIATIGEDRVTIQFFDNSKANPEALLELMKTHPKRVRVTPESKVVFIVPTQGIREVYLSLEELLGRITV